LSVYTPSDQSEKLRKLWLRVHGAMIRNEVCSDITNESDVHADTTSIYSEYDLAAATLVLDENLGEYDRYLYYGGYGQGATMSAGHAVEAVGHQ
jgi:hypothetical protein